MNNWLNNIIQYKRMLIRLNNYMQIMFKTHRMVLWCNG